MLKLLSLEYKKFRKNSVVSTLLLMYIILAPTVIFALQKLMSFGEGLPISLDSLIEFPTSWDYIGYVGNWLFFFFIGFAVIYTITSEISNKTMRQGIINGQSKKEYFLGKLYSIIALSIAATLLYTLSTMVIGMICTPGWDFELMFDSNLAPLKFLLMCLGYLSFAMMVGFVIRSSGLSIFFYLVYIVGIETLLRLGQLSQWQHESVKWWPMNTIEDLMPFPFFKYVDNFKPQEFDFEILLTNNEAMIGSTFYILLFVGMAWFSFKRRDL